MPVSHARTSQTTIDADRTASPPPSDERTLEAVRSVIPASCYRRSWASGLRIVIPDLVLWAGSLWLLNRAHAWWLVVPAVVLVGLSVSAMFVTAHDASHGALLPGQRGNQLVALLFMVPSLHIRSAWDLGHNRIHHGFTVRQGTDFVWHPSTVAEFRSLSPMQRLRHRFEWSWLGSGQYYVREVWWNKMISFRPPARFKRRVRTDRLLLSSLLIAVGGTAFLLGFMQSGLLGGLWSVLKLLVLPFIVFSHVIGWTVHVHHVQRDTAWFTAAAWTRFGAQMEGTTILHIPRVFDLYFHNIFLHVAHHVDMRIPCYHLREAAQAIAAAYPGVVTERRLRLRDYVATTRACKLYDFDAQRWLPYAAAGVA